MSVNKVFCRKKLNSHKNKYIILSTFSGVKYKADLSKAEFAII